MITLEVKSYCQNCSDFHPTVEKFYADGSTYMQIVTCENAQRCRQLCEQIIQSYKDGDKI